ncbi:MAG TPA: extracellular solute-binding protein [Candidatus Paceibacterota bacterium]
MKSFQTILLVIFGAFVIGAVMIFSGVIGGNKANQDNLISEPVIMWGTIPKITVDDILQKVANAGDKFDITYVEQSSGDFESLLIDALAAGKGPDLILVPHTLLIKQRDKLFQLPETTISERLFRDSFVEASENLLAGGDSLGLPLFLDPIVMYWNRDMFTRAGIATAPSTWLEVQLLPEKLTKLDDKGNITEATVAMGGVGNVAHFKDILATQIMQTGDNIVSLKEGLSTVSLGEVAGADSALRYYAEFSNPSLSKYSWNSAKKNSLDEFVSGKLAIYFGSASELGDIETRNPHLNFDTANIPQISNGEHRATYADVYSLAILKNSPVTQTAFAVAYRLALGQTAGIISETLRLPPARRDLLKVSAPNPYLALFYSAAVISKTWYDPSSIVTRNIFADMIDSVIIGKASPSTAISSASARLQDLLNI